MKRKFVLRLLAGVMAATLVVTGVPGTALTGVGIETVYAEAAVSAKTSKSLTVSLDNDVYYTVVAKDTYDAGDYADTTKVSDLKWVLGVTDSVTSYAFENLDPGTTYYVLSIAKAKYSGDKKLSDNSLSLDKSLTGITDKVNLATAKVEVKLAKTSYTYSASGITPEVESLTIDGTEVKGTELAKLFNVTPIAAATAIVANSGKPATQTTIVADNTAAGQKYTGSVTLPAITITPLDLSQADAWIYDSQITSAGKIVSKPYTGSAVELSTGGVYAEGSSTPVVTDGYDFVYSNNTDIGTATVTAVGKGNYTGKISTTYNIVKATPAGAPSFSASNLTATSTTIKAKMTATAGLQYAISTKQSPASWDWVDADSEGAYTFTGLTPDTTYYFAARTTETATSEASAVSSTAQKATTKGDLENAVVTLKDANEKTVTSTTYTYNASDCDPTISVTLDGKTLDVDSDYTITYSYLTADGKIESETGIAKADKSGELKNAGTVRVTISTGSNGNYSGKNTSTTYVINKVKVRAVVTKNATDNTKPYDGTTDATLTAPKVEFKNLDNDTANTGVSEQLATTNNKDLTVKLTSPDVNAAQTIESVVGTTDVTWAATLKNYDITWDASAVTVNVTKQTDIKFYTDSTKGTEITTSSAASQNVVYGIPVQLKAVSNVNLPVTYTIPDEYKDYIEISSDGVLTCKKYTSAEYIPVKLSVASVSNDNCDTTKAPTVYYKITTGQSTASFAFGTSSLTVNTSETEAAIVAKIAAVLKYNTKSTPDQATPVAKEIKLNLQNAKFEYAVASGVYTTGLPTEDGTYTVQITYTGEEAGNLSGLTNTTVQLTISKYAEALVDNTVSKAPVISGDTTFEGAGAVTITAADGATIYYTTDGSTPTTASTKYTGAIAITKTTTIKAIAKETDKEASTVATATFTKKVTADDPEEQLKAAQDELDKANADLEEAQAAAKKAESDKASAVAEAEKAATAAAEKAAAEKIAAAEKAQKAAEEKQAAAEAAQKKAEAAQKAAEDKAAAATTATTKVGDTVKVDGNTYKVTNVKSKTVSFAKVKKNAKTVNIVSSVEINGVTYKVTSIAASAFKGDKKLTSVTIPATVKTIGKNAFNGCTKLKTITINSSKITKIGSKAFSGVSKKAVVKAPSKKVKAYKKLLKKAKFTGTVKKA